MQDDLVVQIECPSGDSDVTADRLWQAGATAVGLDEHDGGATTTLTASFPTNAAARTVAGEIDGSRLVGVDPGWRDEWKQYAEPFDIGRHLRVTPAWRDVEITHRITIRIDPGGSFGSGSHASTRMLLAELDQRPPVGQSVLDLGCGSGILSIAAVVLGAQHVHAVDIDPEAIRATSDNAAANKVGHQITTAAEVTGTYDLTLVNVTAAIHAEVGPAATAATKQGGTILVAGLLPGQWRHVAQAYEGTEVREELELDGWEGLSLVRSHLSKTTSTSLSRR